MTQNIIAKCMTRTPEDAEKASKERVTRVRPFTGNNGELVINMAQMTTEDPGHKGKANVPNKRIKNK